MIELATRAEQVALLFRGALSAETHTVFCRCRGMVRPAIDAAGLEQDLLGHLALRYETEGRFGLAALVAARQEAGERPRFADWLRSVARMTLDPSDRARLMDDLEALLGSVPGAREPANRFRCSY